ncbi:MAG: hypothetical protein KGO23_17170 [Nitrospirota bacterium]|nr:hypothetical protein [Nitrospirota bacterium]
MEQQTRVVTIPPLLRIVLTEAADLLVSAVKMTTLTAVLTFALLLVASFFSSDLPYRALMSITGG